MFGVSGKKLSLSDVRPIIDPYIEERIRAGRYVNFGHARWLVSQEFGSDRWDKRIGRLVAIYLRSLGLVKAPGAAKKSPVFFLPDPGMG